MVGVNLIPVSEQARQVRRSRFARWGVSLTVGLLALVISAGIDLARRSDAAHLRDTYECTQMELLSARTALRGVTDELRHVEHQIEHAAALRTKRPWSGVVALMARSLPVGCWLKSLATDPQKPTPLLRRRVTPSSSEAENAKDAVVIIDAPRRLRIIGYAPEASDPNDFVQALQESAVFARVDLERSLEETILSGVYYRFEVICEW